MMKYFKILIVSLFIPVPLFIAFGLLAPPINQLIFFPSLDESMRQRLSSILGLSISRSTEVTNGIVIAELQFLLLGLLICLVVSMSAARKTQDTQPKKGDSDKTS